MLNTESEKKRLQSVLYAIEQKRHRLNQLALNGTGTKDFYRRLSSKIINTIAQCESFEIEYTFFELNDKTKITGINNPKLKSLHQNVKQACKETAAYLRTLNILVKDKEQTAPEQIKKKIANELIAKERITAVHFALSYILDCRAKNIEPPIGNKRRLEEIGRKRNKASGGNAFYKQFNEIIKQKIDKESTIVKIAGSNWKEIVIALSDDPDKIKAYLNRRK